MASQALLNILDQLRRLPREAATVEFKLNWDKPEDIGGYSGGSTGLDRKRGDVRC